MQDPLSGRRFSPEDIDQRSKIIDEVLKPLEEEIVPGIPMEAFRPHPKEVLPPVVPLESPDLLPMSQMETGVPPVFLPKEPVAPQPYAGIASKEALAKYDSAISDWESEVAKLQKEHQAELASGRKYDETVMDTKIKQAADRFTEKAKRNKAYNKEIIEADAEWQQHLEDAMKKKVFNKPRHWSLQDMMELRTNIGKRLSSAEFHSDKPLTMEKEVLEEIYHNLREEITTSISGLPTSIKGAGGKALDAAEYYDIQSNAIRRMLEGAEVLKGAALNKYKKPDAIANVMALMTGAGVAGGVGLGTHLAGGNLSIPATLLGTAGAGIAYRNVKAGAPQMLARGAKTTRSGIELMQKYHS